jgi:hypothetical protein
LTEVNGDAGARLRRAVLVMIAAGIPLAWTMAPYAKTVDMNAAGEFRTFAGTTFELARQLWEDDRAPSLETAIVPIVFLGLLAPLYPAVFAALALAAPCRLAARRRWVWIAEGIAVSLLSPVGWFAAIFSVSAFMPGASGPRLYPALSLLPGLAAAGGLSATVVGIAGCGRIARIVGQVPPAA